MERFWVLWLVAVLGAGAAWAEPAADALAAGVIRAAIERTRQPETYDGRYRVIAYPNGDVPEHQGVCTDLVVRSFRVVGIDLQRLVHQDMVSAFAPYPQVWGLKRPDTNIDHRRVPNLQVFFRRKGAALPVTRNPADYLPGDIVTWMLPGNLPHIGIVTNRRDPQTNRPIIVHNIGAGP